MDGVSADGTESRAEIDFLVEPNITDAPAIFMVTDTVQSWVNGETNHGWQVATPGDNNWRWHSSEASLAEIRPLLEVVYLTNESRGDFDDDTVLDLSDIEALFQAIRDETHPSTYDLDGDGLVNDADRDFWVHRVRGTWFGDADLDGNFSSSDLVRVFQSGEYEDTLVVNSSWAEGDWNGDAEFGSLDLVLAFQDGRFESGPRPALAAVPELSPFVPRCLTAIMALQLVLRQSRTRRFSVDPHLINKLSR
jgi:hypothetical protein